MHTWLYVSSNVSTSSRASQVLPLVAESHLEGADHSSTLSPHMAAVTPAEAHHQPACLHVQQSNEQSAAPGRSYTKGSCSAGQVETRLHHSKVAEQSPPLTSYQQVVSEAAAPAPAPAAADPGPGTSVLSYMARCLMSELDAGGTPFSAGTVSNCTAASTSDHGTSSHTVTPSKKSEQLSGRYIGLGSVGGGTAGSMGSSTAACGTGATHASCAQPLPHLHSRSASGYASTPERVPTVNGGSVSHSLLPGSGLSLPWLRTAASQATHQGSRMYGRSVSSGMQYTKHGSMAGPQAQGGNARAAHRSVTSSTATLTATLPSVNSTPRKVLLGPWAGYQGGTGGLESVGCARPV
jgi:hypothetical protein